MSKEIYFAELERLLAEGMDYEQAGELAYRRLPDLYADIADEAKQRAKDNGTWPPPAAKKATP